MTMVCKPGAFLPSMLEGEKAVEQLLGKVKLFRGRDPHDAAVVAE